MILDSDIIIGFLRNDEEIVKEIEELREKETKLSTTSVNVMEILKGFFALNKKEEKILEFINNLTILNFDFNSSMIAAEIFDELKRKGQIIDSLDLLIASVVIANNETLWTKNNKHFNRISRLNIKN